MGSGSKTLRLQSDEISANPLTTTTTLPLLFIEPGYLSYFYHYWRLLPLHYISEIITAILQKQTP